MGSASSLVAQAPPEVQLEILKEIEVLKAAGKSDEEMTTILQAKYAQRTNLIEAQTGLITQKTVVVAKPTGQRKVRRQVSLGILFVTYKTTQ